MATESTPQRGWATLGALIRETRRDKGLSQEALAEAVSQQLGVQLSQGVVSNNEKGDRWRPELVYAYAVVLNLGMDDVNAALFGAPRDHDSGRPKGFAEIVREDITLDDDAKAHLLNQYGLLKAASAYNRAARRTRGGEPDTSKMTKDEIAAVEEAFPEGKSKDRSHHSGGAADTA